MRSVWTATSAQTTRQNGATPKHRQHTEGYRVNTTKKEEVDRTHSKTTKNRFFRLLYSPPHSFIPQHLDANRHPSHQELRV